MNRRDGSGGPGLSYTDKGRGLVGVSVSLLPSVPVHRTGDRTGKPSRGVTGRRVREWELKKGVRTGIGGRGNIGVFNQGKRRLSRTDEMKEDDHSDH